MTHPAGEPAAIVAIDGPAGAGKSTVARRLAAALGYAYLDTGAMYRAATWRAMRNGVDMNNPQALAECVAAMTLDMRETADGQKVLVDGEDVTETIRSPEVTREIHWLASRPEARERIVALQRRIGAQGPTVIEGRDAGTVIFPNARLKIYLDASIDERARRRAKELEAKGMPVNLAEIRAAIAERDQRDMTREASPLRRAADAITVDTTGKTIDEVVAEIAALARSRS